MSTENKETPFNLCNSSDPPNHLLTLLTLPTLPIFLTLPDPSNPLNHLRILLDRLA